MNDIPIMPMPAGNPVRSAKVPPLWLPIVLVATSLIVFTAGLSFFSGSISLEPGVVIDAPGSMVMTMQAGTVYGIAMETESAGIDTREFPDVSVTAPDGTALALAEPGIYMDPDLEYVGLVRSPVTADYRVSVGPPPDGDPMTMEVIASPGDSDWIELVGLAVLGVGAMLFLAGAILFIVRIVLLRNSSRPEPA
jgi:hypothetical protein